MERQPAENAPVRTDRQVDEQVDEWGGDQAHEQSQTLEETGHTAQELRREIKQEAERSLSQLGLGHFSVGGVMLDEHGGFYVPVRVQAKEDMWIVITNCPEVRGIPLRVRVTGPILAQDEASE